MDSGVGGGDGVDGAQCVRKRHVEGVLQVIEKKLHLQGNEKLETEFP